MRRGRLAALATLHIKKVLSTEREYFDVDESIAVHIERILSDM